MAAPAKSGNLHILAGNDEGRVKEAAMALVNKLVGSNDPEFGLETINGNADNSDHASRIISQTLEALQTLPFFGGEKVVWLQSANFFGESQTGKSQTTQDALESLKVYLERGVPSDVKLVISATEMSKVRRFYKSISKQVKFQFFDKVDVSKTGWEKKVMSDVSARARAIGIQFAPDALEHFAMMVGADSRQMINELDKLSLYLGDKKIVDIEDVRTITVTSHTGVIFEVGDAIGKRDLPRMIDLIQEQLRAKESAIGILLAAIIPKIRYLVMAKDLSERHRLSTSNYGAFQKSLEHLPPSETSHFSRAKTGSFNVYPLFFAMQHARHFTMAHLRDAHEACLTANIQLVTTGLDQEVVLSQLATRILGPIQRR